MNALIKLPVWLAVWIAVVPIKFATAVSGFAMIPLLYKYRNTTYKKLPFWTRPWANPEDWEGGYGTESNSLPKWWIKEYGISFKSWYHYHAIQNPANGLRSFKLFSLHIDPDKMEYKAYPYMNRYEPPEIRKSGRKAAGYIAWQGFKMGLKVIIIWNDKRHLVIKLGFRVEPRDKVDFVDDLGTQNASFAGKVLVYREG